MSDYLQYFCLINIMDEHCLMCVAGWSQKTYCIVVDRRKPIMCQDAINMIV